MSFAPQAQDVEAPLSPAEVASRLEARVHARLAPLFAAASVAFVLFTLAILLIRPPGATAALATLDATGAVATGVAAALVRRSAWAAARANLVAGVAFLALLGASLFALKILALPSQTAYVMLVELVGSVVLLSPRWTAALLAASLAGWALVARGETWSVEWINSGLALAVTTLLGGTIQRIRLLEARTTEQLEAANAEKAARLERAVENERATARSLAAVNDSLEAFAYVVAHDLKEPIRATGLCLEEAREAPTKAERDEWLARAVEGHARLRRLVEGLLEWSRATTAPLEPEAVDVRRLLEDATTQQVFAPLLAERRGRLLVDPSLPPVLGTPVLLRQVLGNLILNGIRHNPQPDPQVRLYAAPDVPQGRVDLIVEDNGPGMPRAVLERMGKGQPRTLTGGFGLAIARRAVERLGGELHFESPAPGGGTRVHVVLPDPQGGFAPNSFPGRGSSVFLCVLCGLSGSGRRKNHRGRRGTQRTGRLQAQTTPQGSASRSEARMRQA